MSLSRKTSRTLYISQRYEKLVQRRFNTVELGKGNSKKMCLQPPPEGAECLWCCDDGWQTVPDARSSDEEGPVTNVERRDDCVTRADVDAERSLLASMSATRHSSFARYSGAVPCRQRNTSTASLNSIRSRTATS